jgi:hypothetical protein
MNGRYSLRIVSARRLLIELCIIHLEQLYRSLNKAGPEATAGTCRVRSTLHNRQEEKCILFLGFLKNVMVPVFKVREEQGPNFRNAELTSFPKS